VRIEHELAGTYVVREVDRAEAPMVLRNGEEHGSGCPDAAERERAKKLA
jgi:hypothetical protein